MTRPQMQPVPNYTNAFLAMCYVILVPALVVVWGVWGYAAALGLCAALHWGVTQLSQRRRGT